MSHGRRGEWCEKSKQICGVAKTGNFKWQIADGRSYGILRIGELQAKALCCEDLKVACAERAWNVGSTRLNPPAPQDKSAARPR
jgi:hypothetical protein